MNKIPLIILSIPFYIVLGGFDIIKLPIVVMIGGFMLLLSYLKDDLNFNADKRIFLLLLIIGIHFVTEAFFDKELIDL